MTTKRNISPNVSEGLYCRNPIIIINPYYLDRLH